MPMIVETSSLAVFIPMAISWVLEYLQLQLHTSYSIFMLILEISNTSLKEEIMHNPYKLDLNHYSQCDEYKFGFF